MPLVFERLLDSGEQLDIKTRSVLEDCIRELQDASDASGESSVPFKPNSVPFASIQMETDRIPFNPVSSDWQQEKTTILSLPFIIPFASQTPLQIPGNAEPSMSKSIEKDGNSLFRALSFWLTGSEESHLRVRSLIVQYILEHYELLGVEENYIEEENMECRGVPGTDVEVQAAANMMDTRIFIFRQEGQIWQWMSFNPQHCNVDPNDPSLYFYARLRTVWKCF